MNTTTLQYCKREQPKIHVQNYKRGALSKDPACLLPANYKKPTKKKKKCTSNLCGQLRTFMIHFSAFFFPFLFLFFFLFFSDVLFFLIYLAELIYYSISSHIQYNFFFSFFFFLSGHLIDSTGYGCQKLLYLPDFSIPQHEGVRAVVQSTRGPLLLASISGQRLEV